MSLETNLTKLVTLFKKMMLEVSTANTHQVSHISQGLVVVLEVLPLQEPPLVSLLVFQLTLQVILSLLEMLNVPLEELISMDLVQEVIIDQTTAENAIRHQNF